MEAINNSSKLVAQAIQELQAFDDSYAQIQNVIKLLNEALEQLSGKM